MPPVFIISAVMPGILARRTPAFVASSRAVVCDSERVVTRKATDAERIAAATLAGGSCALRSRGRMVVMTGSAPTAAAAAANASAIVSRS
jgi:hypothetical protein